MNFWIKYGFSPQRGMLTPIFDLGRCQRDLKGFPSTKETFSTFMVKLVWSSMKIRSGATHKELPFEYDFVIAVLGKKKVDESLFS